MIRKINCNDKDIYFEMSREFYRSGATATEIDDAKRNVFWNTILENNSLNGYIFEVDGQIAGYAITVYYPSQEYGGNILWIDELFVKPKYRGRGIAKAFFEFAEKLTDKVLLRLEAEPNNKKAISLYESLGFKKLTYIQMIKSIKED